ncbi:hypothetical protein LLI17_003618, partial [Proteus mirabilis]
LLRFIALNRIFAEGSSDKKFISSTLSLFFSLLTGKNKKNCNKNAPYRSHLISEGINSYQMILIIICI